MGLITGGSIVIDPVIISTSSTIITPTAIADTISDHIPSGRVCTDRSSSSMADDLDSFDKSIYRIFSMQDDMKTFTYSGRPRNEFEQFIDDAEKKTAGFEYNVAFDSLDDYLGSIGISQSIC